MTEQRTVAASPITQEEVDFAFTQWVASLQKAYKFWDQADRPENASKFAKLVEGNYAFDAVLHPTVKDCHALNTSFTKAARDLEAWNHLDPGSLFPEGSPTIRGYFAHFLQLNPFGKKIERDDPAVTHLRTTAKVAVDKGAYKFTLNSAERNATGDFDRHDTQCAYVFVYRKKEDDNLEIIYHQSAKKEDLADDIVFKGLHEKIAAGFQTKLKDAFVPSEKEIKRLYRSAVEKVVNQVNADPTLGCKIDIKRNLFDVTIEDGVILHKTQMDIKRDGKTLSHRVFMAFDKDGSKISSLFSKDPTRPQEEKKTAAAPTLAK